MAGIFQVKGSEAKKRALAAESELFRRTIRHELGNLRIFHAGLRRKFSMAAAVRPLLSVAAPMVGLVFGRRHGRRLRLAKAALAGWQLYRKVSRLL